MMNFVGQNGEVQFSNEKSNSDTPFSTDDDSALMTEEMASVQSARCGGQKGDVATPPPNQAKADQATPNNNNGCGQKANQATPPNVVVTVDADDEKAQIATSGEDKVNLATPPDLPEELPAPEEKAENTTPNNNGCDAKANQATPPVQNQQSNRCGDKNNIATPPNVAIEAEKSQIVTSDQNNGCRNKDNLATPPEIPGDLLAASSVDISAMNTLFSRILSDTWQTQNNLALRKSTESSL